MAGAAAQVRGTQSFVHTLSACWRRPAVTALEVAWRWVYGIPALWLVVWQGRKALLVATRGTLDPAQIGLDRALLNDPVGALTADTMGAAGKVGLAFEQLYPALLKPALWVVPLLVLGWVVASSVGRTVVLRRVDGAMHRRIGTLMVLGLTRAGALLALFVGWFFGISRAAQATVTTPLAHGSEPNLVAFCAAVILLSLGLFTAWSAASWVLSVAPLVAMLRNVGVVASLQGASRLGPLRGKLVEVNLVLGIVKIALVVLAMTFSATPLPFQTVTTPEFLACWWAAITVLYLLWSDFFHVARLVSYLSLWRVYDVKS